MTDIILTAGDVWRVTSDVDVWGERPDGDGYGIVLRRDYPSRWSVLHADHGHAGAADQLADRLTTADQYAGPDAVDVALSRAAVDWHGFDTYRGPREYAVIVTAGVLESWGESPTGDQSAAGAAHDWEAWVNGDVHTVTLERRTVPDRCDMRTGWMTGAAVCMSCAADCDCYVCTHETDVWESVVTGTAYGLETVTDHARDLFNTYADAGELVTVQS